VSAPAAFPPKSLRLAALIAAFVLPAASARAHTVGVSRGEYRVSGSALVATLTVARAELRTALPALDADGDGSLSEGELAGARDALAAFVLRGLGVRSSAAICPGSLEDARLTAEDGVVVRAAYRCAEGTRPGSVRLPLLAALSLGHRHLATVEDDSGSECSRSVLYESRPAFEIPAAAPSEAAPVGGVALALFRLGVQHILTGYDHLLFLLGLVLVGGRLRPLLLVITAFTLAHSVTLASAALGVWAPSPRLVEPAIALSIAYVGVENWFVRDAEGRWRITFPFGLVHGFGFAGALREIALPAGQVPLALFAFNLGVEAGQLAALVAVLPAVYWLGRRGWLAGRGVKAASAAVAAAGLFWFVARIAAG
jgi:hydrogenase/urease accessory protein HupE